MHFTLKQLRYFDAALRTGSIAKAAQEMHISQSSITAAIDVLEQYIGIPLFRRVPAKGILPTDAGKIAGQRIAEFLDQSRLFEADLASLSGEPEGVLNLGCYAPSAPHILPPLLKRIAAVYPAIRINLREGDMQKMIDLLHSGAADMALTYRRTTPETMPFLPLFRARPWALLPEDSPLARRDAVTIEDLTDLPMILLDLPMAEEYFCSLFTERGQTPNIVHRTKSSSVLRALVAANFGFSILNICSPADRTGANGYVARPILGRVMDPLFGIAYTASAQKSKLVQLVVEVARDLAQSDAYQKLLLPEE